MYLYLAADKFYNNKLISDQMAPGSSLHACYCFVFFFGCCCRCCFFVLIYE